LLSYRHAFHAGNYADVLKHIVLVEILEYLCKKDKPFDYIDTHAGAGVYRLTSQLAQKNKEFENGIGRLKQADWPELKTYFDIIARFNPDQTLQNYPGSPKIVEAFLRPRDRAWLYEMHSTDYDSLHRAFAKQPKVHISPTDGYDGLISLLPPQSKRALTLIDPSYEIKQDYQQVVDVLIKAHRRFATGIYAIWYPVIERRRINTLEQALLKSGIPRIQLFELGQQSLSQTSRMHAAGMVVVNPPWPLFAKMQTLLPKLAKVMTIVGKPHYRCVELVGE
jgi:23S rRNA (adenine2030-N6)-methyltransferase